MRITANPLRTAAQLLALAGLPLALVNSAAAQTWTGGSAIDSNWTTSANWTALPTNNGTANVIFAGSNRLSPFVNTAQDVNSVTFNNTAGIFNIGGANTLTIRAGGITNNDTQAQSFGCPVAVAVSQTWSAASGPLNMNGAITVSNGLTLDGANPITFAGTSSGNGSITKNGTGVWFLSGASTVAGGFLLGGGTLRLGANNVLPDTAIISMIGTAVLDVNTFTDSVGAFGSVFPGTQVQLPGNSSLTFGGANTNSNFAGTISGASTATLTKIGTGTLTLNGSNTFSGTITVQSGTLALGSSERLADTCNVVVNGASAALSVPSGATETINQLTVLNGGSLTGGGTISVNSGYVVGAGSTTCNLAGSGGFIKNGSGDFIISPPALCTFTGTIDLQAGNLVLNRQNGLPFTSVNIAGGAALQIGDGIQQSLQALGGNGSVVLGSFVSNTILTIGNDSFVSSVFTGVVSGPGGLTKVGSSCSLTLTGANVYTGNTRINGGIVELTTGPNRLPPATALIIDGGTLRLDSVDQTVLSLQLLNSGSVTSPANSSTLTASNFDLRSGTISAQLGGTGRLVKMSTGTVVLTQSNSYSGGTLLVDGVLEIPTDSALGTPDAPLTIVGLATLRINQECTIHRPIVINTLAGGLNIDTPADVTLNGSLTGDGFLGKLGTGRLVFGVGATLTSFSIYAGEIFVPSGIQLTAQSAASSAGGTLRVAGSASILTSTGYENSGTLALTPGSRFNSPMLLNSGVVSGSGTINAPLDNRPTGDIRIAADDAMLFTATAAQTTAGLIEVRGGSVEFTGPLTNAASTGLIFARDATLRFNAGLTNAGSIALSFGTSDVFGDINNLAGGIITVTGRSNATFLDDVINNGVLRTSAGSASVFLGALSGSGTFPGTGTVYMEGDLRPGNSPGLMTFGGDLVLGSGAGLQIQLAGLEPTDYDRVEVSRNASLDGTLSVQLVGGFVPQAIQHFTVLTASSIDGRFASLDLPAIGAPLYVYTSATTVTITTCSADFNLDDVVNADDISDFITGYFNAPPDPATDFNNDGLINSDDLSDYITSYFNGC